MGAWVEVKEVEEEGGEEGYRGGEEEKEDGGGEGLTLWCFMFE